MKATFAFTSSELLADKGVQKSIWICFLNTNPIQIVTKIAYLSVKQHLFCLQYLMQD